MKRIFSALARMFSIGLMVTMLQGCSANHDRFTLTIAHINDTHSHVEPSPVAVNINGVRTDMFLGGMARLKTAVDDLRRDRQGFMLLHAGDAVQGTLYFNLFKGRLDFELLNMMGVDAMTFGNHEFDRGPFAIQSYLVTARFPILSANIDFSDEPAVANLVSPFVIRHLNGEKIGLVGVTTESTPISTLSVGKARFNDSLAGIAKAVTELKAKGVNKIIVLSHLGYAEDRKLASRVEGVDVIVGGHTHTLLGDASSLSRLGISPEAAYPTVVMSPAGKKVLVLQAWQWGFMLGAIDINFDTAGEITDFSDQSRWILADRFSRNGLDVEAGSKPYREITTTLNNTLNMRVVPEDPQMARFILPYTRKLSVYRENVIAVADAALVKGTNSGPGPLVAESMLSAVPAARVALMNYGGIRKNLQAGKISVGDVMEVLPFGGTLHIVDLSGSELKAALEEGIQFLENKFSGVRPLPLPYISGGRYTVDISEPFGKRVKLLEIKDDKAVYQPVRPAAVYRCIVNNFIAGGGDGFAAVRNSRGFRSDTGILDTDAFINYLKVRAHVTNPVEPLVTVVPSLSGPVPATGRGDVKAKASVSGGR